MIQVDGIKVIESYWRGATDELGRRVMFDIDCPPAAVRFRLFKRIGRYPSEVGATGCGRRATYVRAVGGRVGPWVLNVYSGPQSTAHGGHAAHLPNEGGDDAVGGYPPTTGSAAAGGYGGRVERRFDETRKLHMVRGQFTLAHGVTLWMLGIPALTPGTVSLTLRGRKGTESLLSCEAIEVLVNAEPVAPTSSASTGTSTARQLESRFDYGIFAPLAQQHAAFGIRVCEQVVPFSPPQVAEVQKFLAIYGELTEQAQARQVAPAPDAQPPPVQPESSPAPAAP